MLSLGIGNPGETRGTRDGHGGGLIGRRIGNQRPIKDNAQVSGIGQINAGSIRNLPNEVVDYHSHRRRIIGLGQDQNGGDLRRHSLYSNRRGIRGEDKQIDVWQTQGGLYYRHGLGFVTRVDIDTPRRQDRPSQGGIDVEVTVGVGNHAGIEITRIDHAERALAARIFRLMAFGLGPAARWNQPRSTMAPGVGESVALALPRLRCQTPMNTPMAAAIRPTANSGR